MLLRLLIIQIHTRSLSERRLAITRCRGPFLPNRRAGEEVFLKKSFGKKRFVTLDKSFYPVCGSSLARYHPSPRSPKEEKATSHPSHVRTSAYMCFPPSAEYDLPLQKTETDFPLAFFSRKVGVF